VGEEKAGFRASLREKEGQNDCLEMQEKKGRLPKSVIGEKSKGVPAKQNCA